MEEPAEFATEFARAAIDAGADAVAGHGPHLTLGVEIYNGRPILYSLGNFVFQNDNVATFPAESYQRFGLGPDATPTDFLDARTGNGTRGFPAEDAYWHGLAAECRFKGGKLAELKLHPLDLGFGKPRSQRGRPLLARGATATAILDRVARLSQRYGAKFTIQDEIAVTALS
jgi:poly-gamma-glutamate synthesis protein (capsule biosynthesis protein)